MAIMFLQESDRVSFVLGLLFPIVEEVLEDGLDEGLE